MKYFYVLVLVVILVVPLSAQDTVFARRMIQKLASPEMQGRGFALRADLRAAKYIASVMNETGLAPVAPNYFFPFEFSANTFAGNIALKINDRLLHPQTEYFYSLSSPDANTHLRIERLFNDTLKGRPGLKALRTKNLSKAVVITDLSPDKLADSLPLGVAAIFYQADSGKRLVWRSSDAVKMKPYISGKLAYNTVMPSDTAVDCIIEGTFINKGEAVNVAGMIRGTKYPDRYQIIGAHYDHLGLMGLGNHYPGGNDNASGVAMMLDMARYYAQPDHKPACSMLFVAFSGEESGLWGSEAFAANLPVAADSIVLMLNLDMVGTGSGGITAVNGEANPVLYQRLSSINAENEFVATVKNRGPSCNSDHCPFDKLGIPALFIYSMGKEWPYYHVAGDTDRVPLTEYPDIVNLLIMFMNQSTLRVH